MEESRALTIPDAQEISDSFARSGLFPDAKQGVIAFVKIMAGQELGIGPFAAMTGIHVIQGKATLGAGIIASRIKASAKYDYRIVRLDDEGCELVFLEGGEQVGRSAFDKTDAEAAGVLSNPTWKKYPRNMYFARAISNGARWYCPDVFSGPVYTADELGSDVDVVDVTPMVVEPEPEPPWYGKDPGAIWGWLKRKYGLTSDDLHRHGVHLSNFKTREDFLEWATGPECQAIVALVTAERAEQPTLGPDAFIPEADQGAH